MKQVSVDLWNCRKMLQSLGRPELHMALEVVIVSGSGQEHAGCLLLTSEVLFVVSVSEDTQQQAFPITEVTASPMGVSLRGGGGLIAPPFSRGAYRCWAKTVSVTAGVSRQVECQQEPDQQNQLTLTLQQQTVNTEPEVRLPMDAII